MGVSPIIPAFSGCDVPHHAPKGNARPEKVGMLGVPAQHCGMCGCFFKKKGGKKGKKEKKCTWRESIPHREVGVWGLTTGLHTIFNVCPQP